METKSTKIVRILGVSILCVFGIIALSSIIDKTICNKIFRGVYLSIIQASIVNIALFLFFKHKSKKNYFISTVILSLLIFVNIYIFIFHFLDSLVHKYHSYDYLLFVPVAWILCGISYAMVLKKVLNLTKINKGILIASILYIPFSLLGVFLYDATFIVFWNLITLIVFMLYFKEKNINNENQFS